jgi:hypothetical protein
LDKTQEEIKRGHLAKQIIDNPLWSEFFETARDRISESWEKSTSPEYREDLWRYLQVLRTAEKHMRTALETGQLAEMALAEMQEKENGGSSTEH